jgi:hypothetical protein
VFHTLDVTTECLDRVVGAIEELTQAIDDLIAEGAEAHGDSTSIKALVCQHARLESVVSSAVGAHDTSGEWALDGARSAPAWLARSCRLPKAVARRMVRRSRHLRHLPVVAAAFEEGAIHAAHVDAVAALRRDATGEALARDEALLVTQAKGLRFEHFAKAVSYWDQLADPDGTEEAAEARRARRDVFLEASSNGMYLGSITLDAIGGSIVAGELGRIEDEFFRADWAAARDQAGPNPTIDRLWRTPAQRRADALVEMAARSSVVQPEGVHRPPAPLFSVLVDWPTLSGRVCELAEGVVVSPGELVPWLWRADLERAVMEPSGRVEVAKTRRLFSGATRRAIELRDRACVHPFCDVAGSRCQADHIVPWAQSGRTTQDNGRLLCGFHNRLRNQRPPPQRE